MPPAARSTSATVRLGARSTARRSRPTTTGTHVRPNTVTNRLAGVTPTSGVVSGTVAPGSAEVSTSEVAPLNAVRVSAAVIAETAATNVGVRRAP